MNGVHFEVHQDQNLVKLDYEFLLNVARHVQSIQERKFLTFLQCIATAFVMLLFYCDAKHSDPLGVSSHVCSYLFLGGCSQKWACSFRSWNSEMG